MISKNDNEPTDEIYHHSSTLAYTTLLLNYSRKPNPCEPS